MQCTNCGKDVPFTGNVCPHCGVEKKHDKTQQSAMKAAGCLVFLLIVSIATMVGADFLSSLVMGFIGAVLAQVVVMTKTAVPKQRIAPTIQRVEDAATGDTKSCPYCAETIKSAAVKCRFCGSELNK
jgi:cobalamin biosynthesis protein CobD/CbiB